MAKAPYNFVPVNTQVFFPDWSEKISHDIPFSDGESGRIDIEIEAVSPLFIRNSKDSNNDRDPAENFFQAKGLPYIPGSSLKGMIRNMVEIIGYGKLKPVENGRYSIRDFDTQSDFSLKDPTEAKHIRGGFLFRKDGKIFLKDAGKPGRISHADIDAALRTDFVTSFKGGGRLTKGGTIIEERFKTAAYKYEVLNKAEGSVVHTFKQIGVKKPLEQPLFAIDSNGEKGQLVFTGQPSPRTTDRNGKLSGKFYEFVFVEQSSNGGITEISEAEFKAFEFIHKNHTKGVWAADWAYWRGRFQQGEKVPVFYRGKGAGTNLKVIDFGLAFMYKQAWPHGVHDLLKPMHKHDSFDLAECMFGPVTDDRDREKDFAALKGRIQFGHAVAIGSPLEAERVSAILGGPSASFYPFYLRQGGKSRGTYNSDSSSLAGWKRYPVHRGAKPALAGQANDKDVQNEKVLTRFTPLDEGSKFESSIYVHNLRTAEVGALLSALTFHRQDGCFHSLGMAKSLGYGKVKIELKGLHGFSKHEVDYLKSFEWLLISEFKQVVPRWEAHASYCELMTMATEQSADVDATLVHMQLDEFARVKTNLTLTGKAPLPAYTKISGVQAVRPVAFVDEVFLQEKKAEEERRQATLQQRAKEEEEQRRKQEEEEQKRQKEEEERKQKEKQEQKRADGLRAELDKITKIDYNQIAGRINQYLRSARLQLLSSEDDLAVAFEKLDELHVVESKKKNTLKQWEGGLGKSARWKKISTWIGDELAEEWHNKFMV